MGDDRDLARLKGGIAGLKYLNDELRSLVIERLDEIKEELRRLQTTQTAQGERLAAVEARSTDLREEVTARHRAVSPTSRSDPSLKVASKPPPEKPHNVALDTLKAIGPWIIAGISLVGTIVNALVRALGGH